MNSFKLLSACLLIAVQGCATQTELAAPPAPCASTARDCGPAHPLNQGLAALPGPASVLAG